ncbi:MAG: 5'-methylthioadenosine phosphorylase [uncultured Thermoleophilia bacterium]|uniref:S-methyl-5'-thioadenosine phosphorylase n=1 Tax=uncultured Thermoleophilia bacterium TaxID=1497501 RepID=A0A6J4TQ14_9ACTN|nr:MAG: 5'-methylthioadenosine phosphorylase [uncultured Thermoleophilia bacterium]
MAQADIGVFGGSGFTRFLDDVEEVAVETPYGPPSDRFSIGEVGGRRVAFLPRHGRHHTLPPHRIPYRANLWAMRALGVRRILGPCAAGSLDPAVPPGSFVVCDQFVDRTRGRDDTYYDGPEVTHVAAADPYCPDLRRRVVATGRALGIDVRDGGTVVVVNGPRFSTRAESAWFRAQGWQVVNMTAYPEAWLARELALCYANVALITDYDVGVEGADGVSAVDAVDTFRRHDERLRDLLSAVIPTLGPQPADDPCAAALDDARF